MCPISGMVQFLVVLVTLLLVCHVAIVRSLKVVFEPKNVSMHMYDVATVDYEVLDWKGPLKLYVQHPDVVRINGGEVVFVRDPKGSFNLTGNFLGRTQVVCAESNDKLDVVVTRKKRVIDTIFTSSVATLVSVLYINFGCALNWKEMLQSLKKPVGPVIGFASQFIVMPLLSFGLGALLFPGNPAMQLGMFFTGVSPAGGASNIWTLVLEGNINLSITMTTISTFAAFFMMPMWLFTLGRLIFQSADIQVPYDHISTYAVALVIPLGIGFLLSRYAKRVASFLVRILKGLSALLLVFIIVFAIITNLYLFELFSWQIVIAGMGLPWLGYSLGYLAAKVLRQPDPDCLAIAIETGVQNTGIAIFLLRFALPQPEADLTTIVPVSVAIMTPIPLVVLFVYKKLRARMCHSHQKLSVSQETAIDDNSNSQKSDCRLIRTIS